MTADVQSLERRCPDKRGVGFFIVAGIVILLGISQIFLAVFVIARFSKIFQEMIGDYPLPMLTMVVINCRWALVGLDCVWLLATLFLVQRRAPLDYLFAILALQLVQIAFTVIALFLPISGTIIKQRSDPVQSNNEAPRS